MPPKESVRPGPGAAPPGPRSVWLLGALLCALVVGLYASLARPAAVEEDLPASEQKYNLLVEGFRAGRLSVNAAVPSGLAALPDPYDPAADRPFREPPYRLHDLSYYKGRLYLYFGPTPALVLFWPWAAVTGRYLTHRQAVLFFCTAGFLASLHLLRALTRREGSRPEPWHLVVGVLGLGLCSGLPLLLLRTAVYEVAISCAFACVMAALCAVERALNEPARRVRWLVLASLCEGLAVGARPSVLFGAVMLLAPVAAGWREGRGDRKERPGSPVWRLAAAALTPLVLAVIGLLAYNHARFGRSFDFGQRYQLAAESQSDGPAFSLSYAWYNLRLYFLGVNRWSLHFPFSHSISPPPPPTGHYPLESTFGILPNLALIWLALAAPSCLLRRSASRTGPDLGLALSVLAVFASSAFVLCLFRGTCQRYEAEFLPALALAALGSGFLLDGRLAGRPAARSVYRGAVVLALGWSLLCTAVVASTTRATLIGDQADSLVVTGHIAEAVDRYEAALGLVPESYARDFGVMRNNLGNALAALPGRDADALRALRESTRLNPDLAEAHYDLGLVLMRDPDRRAEAAAEFRTALRINPDLSLARNNLGGVLAADGRLTEAAAEFREALRIDPGLVDARNNLGNALVGQGRFSEAAEAFREALRAQPGNAQVHNNLGLALARGGRVDESVGEFREAIRINPGYVEAHANLGIVLSTLPGRAAEAIPELQTALRLNPDFEAARRLLDQLQAPR